MLITCCLILNEIPLSLIKCNIKTQKKKAVTTIAKRVLKQNKAIKQNTEYCIFFIGDISVIHKKFMIVEITTALANGCPQNEKERKLAPNFILSEYSNK